MNRALEMKPSNEFFSFCSGLHQDFARYGPKPEDWIDGALQFLSVERLPVLRDYIAGLLAGGYSDAELQQIYRATPSELKFGTMVAFGRSSKWFGIE